MEKNVITSIVAIVLFFLAAMIFSYNIGSNVGESSVIIPPCPSVTCEKTVCADCICPEQQECPDCICQKTTEAIKPVCEDDSKPTTCSIGLKSVKSCATGEYAYVYNDTKACVCLKKRC